MRIKALFVGLSESRARRLGSLIETASSITLGVNVHRDPGEDVSKPIHNSDVVFLTRHIKDSRLEQLLDSIRKHRADLPIVIACRKEPDGKAFLLANRYRCWLFSEADRVGRTVTPAEIATMLANKFGRSNIQQRLVEISLSTGPCSTGD